MGSNYQINNSNVGAVGEGATGHNLVIESTSNSQIGDLAVLAHELQRLAQVARSRATEPEQLLATGQVDAATAAAQKGDGAGAVKYLAAAGEWVADIAKEIGSTIVTAILKGQLGLP